MTKGMTYAATSVQKFRCRQLRFGFELRPPIAESLERNPLRFAILSLIQRALLPRLMVLAPESLAVTFTGSKFVGHLVSSLSKFVGENRSRPNRGQQVCEKWTCVDAPSDASRIFCWLRACGQVLT